MKKNRILRIGAAWLCAAIAANAQTVYTGFYRGSAMPVGLYQFTDPADPQATGTRIGTWPFPASNWQCSGFGGTRYLLFGRASTGFGGPGLYTYDGGTSLSSISGSYTFSDWHGIAEYDGEYFGLYGGTNMTGSGLYRFTDPTDPENTATRMFPTQSFDSSVWKGVAYDGSAFLFVRSAEGGTPGIYEYAFDFDDFTLVSGGETYTDWDGLGAYTEPVEPPILAQPSNKKVYVILFGGQSNAAGWGYRQYLLDEDHPLADPQGDVEMYTGSGTAAVLNQLLPLQSGAGNDFIRSGVMQYPALTNAPVNRFGPELSMARTVRDGIDILDSKVVVIKYAVGGSTLYGHWKADGTADSSSDGALYKTFQSTVNAGIAAIQAACPYHEVEVIGMGWVQGESDALNVDGANAAAYEANLTTFIADVRATFGTNMVFALSRLSTNQSDNAYWPTIRAAQAAVAAADPRVVATGTDGPDYPGADGFSEGRIHFLSSALLQIGEDLGHALVETAVLDADGDRLPDAWENSFSPPGAAGLGNAPADDYDGDGIPDRAEFLIGTSPVDAEDGLQLSITNAAALQWSAKRGISYAVEYSTNLTSWGPFDTLLLESNRVAMVSIAESEIARAGFFRLTLAE
jgi:hypothetical protein